MKRDILRLSIVAMICVTMLLSAGILGRNIQRGLLSDRVITSRGSAEQSVIALSASIEVVVRLNDYTVEDARNRFNDEYNNVYNSVNDLVSTNFANSRIESTDIVLNDSRNEYVTEWVGDRQVRVRARRYSVSRTIRIHTTEVVSAQRLRDEIESKLIIDGLSTYATVSSVRFVYPNIDSIKPELLERSYADAHRAAEQFARDSGQSLGRLKTANQGFVSLTPNGYRQTARIVTDATFYID